MSKDVKRVEYILQTYKILLERRPHYGVRAVGKERRMRRLLCEFIEKGEFAQIKNLTEPASIEQVRKVAADVIAKHSLLFFDADFYKLTLSSFVAIYRLSNGFTTENDDDADLLAECDVGDDLMMAAAEMAERFGELGKVEFGKYEFAITVIQLKGKTVLDSESLGCEGYRVSEKIQRITFEMLDEIYDEFGIDLSEDLKLRMSLITHFIPLDIRMRYEMPLSNPMTAEIREHYSFAFSVATRACTVLEREYGRPIPADEVAFITPFIVIAMEKRGKAAEKKKVLLVCSTGKASSQLLAYKFEEEFSSYLSEVHIKDLFSFAPGDENDYDFIFSTVPITFETTKPVFEVSPFLFRRDIDKVRGILSREGSLDMREYYRPELFFADIEAEEKWAVISEICARIAKVRELPDGFEQAIVERERFFSTDYGNLVAFPHPMVPLCNDTFVSVSVLKRPIMWGRNMVQVVLTVSVAAGENSKERLKQFYGVLTNLITAEARIKALIDSPSYQTLMMLLG